jgi:hypothetical protein
MIRGINDPEHPLTLEELNVVDQSLIEVSSGNYSLSNTTCVCNKTNLMHYLSSVYSVITPLYVLGLLVAHHEEVAMYIGDN